MVEKHATRSFKRLQLENLKLSIAMGKALSNEEFQILRSKHNRIAALLGHPIVREATLEEFTRSAMSHSKEHSPRTDFNIVQSPLNAEKQNLESVQWYLNRIGERIESTNSETLSEFKARALAASKSISALISVLDAKQSDTSEANLSELNVREIK